MKIWALVRRGFVCASTGILTLAYPMELSAAEEVAFKVGFDISCSPPAQDRFNDAVTLLHSFEYPETTRLFAELIEDEPDCAMAYWGAAMSIWHPLWAPPSAADLERGAAVLARTDGMNVSPREAAFIDALKTFFSSTERATHRERAGRYADRMGDMYAAHVDDTEVAVFYSLALLASANPRDKSYTNQYKSAALLNYVRDRYPTHPGVLHYLIHSYDYPGLAHLAYEAAKIYAGAAPDSAHAQHMPSHIFTRLGMWDRSLASNHDSTRSAAEYTVRAKLPGHYDEGLHSIDYLMYAMLQTARDEEAGELLAHLLTIGKTDTENFKVAFTYASSAARYALERRQWAEASRLELLPSEFLWADFPWARSIHHFARGVGAARAGKVDAARQELAAIRELTAGVGDETHGYFREQMQVQADAVRAWILLAEGRTGQALEHMLAAATLEDATDKHPVTPGEVLPARELYADMLFETGRYDQALAQYEIVLAAAPNRLNAMLGAAAAAGQAGETALAEGWYATLRKQTAAGNRQRARLDRIWMSTR